MSNQQKAMILMAGAVALAMGPLRGAESHTLHTFQKIVLSDQFYCEGAHYGDFNRDGRMEVVAGPYWYSGPGFKERHEFRPAKAYDPGGYSDNFLTYVWDFNGDQWPDILIIDTPGQAATWYENPQGKPGHWAAHVAFAVVDNESPTLADLTGDGRPELVCNTEGRLGYAEPDWSQPTQPWTFHALSPKGSWHKYTHGLGVGDVNGDGRNDFIEIEGWWEQPASRAGDPIWKSNPFRFGEGGAQILTHDFDGDGDADIVTCLQPHKYGLAWFEQVRENGAITFREHRFMGDKPEQSPYGLKFTQMHAFDLVDMDKDGVKDFVTGKRWWAHKPPTDPESDAPAVLYWFRTVRSGKAGEVDFVPYKIDDNSGVGTQVTTGDLNGDGWADVIVGNKKGVFVFLHETRQVTREAWEKAQPVRLK